MIRDVWRGFLFGIQLPITILALVIAVSPIAGALIGIIILAMLMEPAP